MGDGPVWLPESAAAVRPPLDARVEADVCVVGLGGSGLAVVAEAQRLGRSVVGIDGGAIACGAAGRNGGFLLAGAPDFHHAAVAALGHDRAVAVYRLTLNEIDALKQAMPSVVRRVGSLRVGDDEAEVADCAAMLDALRRDGFEAEWHEGPEGAGVLMPADAAFDPFARCHIQADAVARQGARLFEQSPAIEISTGLVTTPAGAVACGSVVVAVDGGLERVLPELAGRVRTARLQMLATEPVGATVTTRPVYARWGYDYWQQLPSGALAVGGCRDRFAEDEWSFDAAPTAEVQACLDQLLRGRIGVAPSVNVTHRWAGCAAFTDTRMPVCEEVRPGVFAAGGYCGTGNVLGALCGRAAVRLALNQPLAELAPVLSTSRNG
jgi:glycine/D-amino acid oxidase-like deaminating enzyme